MIGSLLHLSKSQSLIQNGFENLRFCSWLSLWPIHEIQSICYHCCSRSSSQERVHFTWFGFSKLEIYLHKHELQLANSVFLKNWSRRNNSSSNPLAKCAVCKTSFGSKFETKLKRKFLFVLRPRETVADYTAVTFCSLGTKLAEV